MEYFYSIYFDSAGVVLLCGHWRAAESGGSIGVATLLHLGLTGTTARWTRDFVLGFIWDPEAVVPGTLHQLMRSGDQRPSTEQLRKIGDKKAAKRERRKEIAKVKKMAPMLKKKKKKSSTPVAVSNVEASSVALVTQAEKLRIDRVGGSVNNAEATTGEVAQAGAVVPAGVIPLREAEPRRRVLEPRALIEPPLQSETYIQLIDREKRLRFYTNEIEVFLNAEKSEVVDIAREAGREAFFSLQWLPIARGTPIYPM